MDTLNYDAHNILLNGQPYPTASVRPIYPTFSGDNTVSLLFPRLGVVFENEKRNSWV